MKKIYSKPQIVFDSFELSQSIAAGCEYISNHALGSCALTLDDLPGMTFFTSEIGACELTPPGEYDRICYDVHADNSSVFSS